MCRPPAVPTDPSSKLDEPPLTPCGETGLRLLLLVHHLAGGGAETSVYNLACALRRLGCPPVLCGWRRRGPWDPGYRAAGIALELPGVDPLGWRRLTVPAFLRAVVARHRVNVIHAHLSDSAAWAVLLQWLTGQSCVVTHHTNDLVDTVGQGGRLYRWLRRQLLVVCARRAALNIAVSESIRDRLVQATGLSTEHVLVIPNGVPLPPESAVESARLRRRARAASGFRGDSSPTVLYVGRLTEQKGVDTLIRALPQLLASHPNATLVVVGQGPREAALRSLTEELGLAERTQFVGVVRDVNPWLAEADIFASGSHLEGLSVAVLEAMSWGLPVVASDIPGHREIVRPGETGALVPVGAPGELAQALLAALQHWADTEASAQRARALVEEEYSAEGVARRHLQVYQTVAVLGKATKPRL